ncbi:peptide ABC transporter substrate-binding protein [Ktedonospora formicarum]|uniref:Solute-binding protein family 5 domain-containing protein n=1 Tax=Ktedonospora formicarum TaxID=2778364 RepID=A0A8J3MUI9_9CHLR|nr:peptide ABC transporter substrate-binding protein [Ktedonospora formicarum]GHO45455.1 hypothetical protein KSX_36180 [Ktedonospora formicarum]
MFTLLCLLLILCTNWIYPRSDAHSQQARDKQIFIWPIAGTSDITTLDPALNSDGYSSQAIQMVFTGLVQLNNKLEVEPQLAQSYAREPTTNGFIWTFRLRPHLTFSDGTALTAHDVIWSIDRALQPETGSNVAMLYLGLIKDAEKLDSGNVQTLIGDSLFAPDPMTVKIITTTGAPYFLSALTYPTSYVVNPRLIERYKETWTEHIPEGAGAGPFQVSSYTHTRDIHFIANPHYYGPHPQLHEVIMPFYPSSEALYQAYQNNQVSYATISTTDQARVSKADKMQLHRTPLLWTQYIAFNYLARPFDNIKIRQAFALALDKVQLTQNINKGTLMPTNHILPKGLPKYNSHALGPAGIQSLHGDQHKAQQLFNEGLKEEGLTRQTLPPLRLTSAYTTTRRKQNIEAIQQQWNSVLGIHVKLDHVNFASFQAAIPATRHNPHGLMMWENSWVANVADPMIGRPRSLAKTPTPITGTMGKTLPARL